MNKKNKIIYRQIGKKTFLKYSVLTVLMFVFLPIVVFTPYYLISSEPGSGLTYAKNMLDDISKNIPFLIIQTVVVIFCIWYFASIPVRHIVEHKRNRFWTSFVALIFLWAILFVSSELTGGIIHSMTYGWKKGFEAAVFDWFLYTLAVWSIFAIISGLIIAPFIGKEIKKRAVEAKIM